MRMSALVPSSFSLSKTLGLFALAAVIYSAPASASQGWTECMGIILNKTELPYEHPKNVRICRSGVLAISYDGDKKNPAFSQYYITPEQARNTIPGRESFYEDPDLKAMGVPQAKVTSKAFGEDWNRGHLAPNRIMSFSTVGKKSCFSMANIAPQGGYFNQQPWERTETRIANFVAEHVRGLYIITGVSYTDRSKPRRSVDNIAVPNHYWTVICDPVARQSAGFFGVNEIKTATLTSFVPVQQIERMYGGRLFNALQCMTGVVDRKFWWPGPDNLGDEGEVEVFEEKGDESRPSDRGVHAGRVAGIDLEIAEAAARVGQAVGELQIGV